MFGRLGDHCVDGVPVSRDEVWGRYTQYLGEYNGLTFAGSSILLPIVVRGILQLALEGWGAAAARPLVVAPPELADYAETIAARHGLSSMDDIHIVVDNVSRDVIVGQFEAGRPIVLVEPCTYDGALVETNYNILDGIAARGYGTAERFFIPSDTPVPFRAAGHFSDPFRVEYYLFTPLNQ